MEKSIKDVKAERDDVERAVGSIQQQNMSVKAGRNRKLLLWIPVNIVATMTIVRSLS